MAPSDEHEKLRVQAKRGNMAYELVPILGSRAERLGWSLVAN